MTAATTVTRDAPSGTKPRLGFLGVGWIGRHRMDAIAESGAAEIAAMADASRVGARERARARAGVRGCQLARGAARCGARWHRDRDAQRDACGANHRALERGVAVFCQKPLARTAAETRHVIEAARTADRLLGVDLSYRFTEGMQRIRELVRGGELGSIFAVDLVFHNAYGPDKPWFFDPRLSGGGCVIDLGIHLVDLALWTLDFPRVSRATSRLFSRGEPLVLLTVHSATRQCFVRDRSPLRSANGKGVPTFYRACFSTRYTILDSRLSLVRRCTVAKNC